MPRTIYERKDKKGFVTPGETKWLKGPLNHLMEINYNNISGFINKNVAKKVISDYDKGDLKKASLVWRIAAINDWIKCNT